MSIRMTREGEKKRWDFFFESRESNKKNEVFLLVVFLTSLANETKGKENETIIYLKFDKAYRIYIYIYLNGEVFCSLTDDY